MSFTIRPERPEDIAPIRALVDAAFRNLPHAHGNEGAQVDQLRKDGDLALSLVATNMDEAVIGHIAIAPIVISDGSKGWYSIGPVSVIPTRQRTGIGGMLLKDGLSRMRASGAQGCVVLGDPRLYGGLGFEADPQLVYPDAGDQAFQRLLLAGKPACGTVRYAPAFG